jgi:hypothetical protein
MTLIEIVVAFTLFIFFLTGALQAVRSYSSNNTINLIRSRMLQTVSLTGEYLASMKQSAMMANMDDVSNGYRWDNLGVTDAMNSSGGTYSSINFLTVNIDETGRWQQYVTNPDPAQNTNLAREQNDAFDSVNGGPIFLMLGGFWATPPTFSASSNLSAREQQLWAAEKTARTTASTNGSSGLLPSPILYEVRVFQEVMHPTYGHTVYYYRVRAAAPDTTIMALCPPGTVNPSPAFDRVKNRLQVENVYQQQN